METTTREIKLRRISLAKAKKEIFDYLLRHPYTYPYEVADVLNLELSLVHKALSRLRKEGKAEEETRIT